MPEDIKPPTVVSNRRYPTPAQQTPPPPPPDAVRPEVLCAYAGSILVILEGEYEPPDKF